MDTINGRESAAEAEHERLGEIDDRRRTTDRRRASRRKILKAGRTFWPNGDSSECLVYNLSESGAQLEIRGPLPNGFDLVIEGDTWRRSCAVVWRKANRAGVQFRDCAQLVASQKSRSHQFVRYRQFAEMCQSLAERTAPSERELLLEMSGAWLTVIRQLRRKSRRREV
jgi:hypothetical protein